jgi:serine/threonine protein kinase
MEHLGPSLGYIIGKKGKNFSLGQVVALGIQLINSIESLHNLGFVHCDIKPSNILVGLKNDGSNIHVDPKNLPEHKVYLVDFGLCHKYINIFDLYK